MGKKKGKKGGKKGKGKKGGKKKEAQMTAQEAILAYQIGIVEKKLEDVMYEIRGWEEKNLRNQERNEKLKSEQELLVQHLLQQARQADKFFENEEIKSKDDVVEAMKQKWARQREREREVEELKTKIAKTEEEIAAVKKDLDYWTEYKNKGQHEHRTHIQIINGDMKDMENSFEDMKGYLEKGQNKAKLEITSHTDEELEKQKYKATENAIAQLDKYSRQEVLDNDWLRREVDIHSRDVADLRKIVEELERGNLEIMSDLFECKIEDLKVSRNFFLTQFEENENLDESGVLEMDLASLKIDTKTPDPNRAKTIQAAESRPQSATQRYVENKVFNIVRASLEMDDVDEEDESDDESADTELLDNMFFEEEDFSDYLQLGPLELKLLNITGEQMPIHAPPELSREEVQAKDCQPDNWPVTQPMLQAVAKTK